MAAQNNCLVVFDFFFGLGTVRKNSFVGDCITAKLFIFDQSC